MVLVEKSLRRVGVILCSSHLLEQGIGEEGGVSEVCATKYIDSPRCRCFSVVFLEKVCPPVDDRPGQGVHPALDREVCPEGKRRVACGEPEGPCGRAGGQLAVAKRMES